MKNVNRVRKTVFIVDDQPVYSGILKNDIQDNFTTVKEFSNGEDCLASMDQNPDIVVLDFELDDGSGTVMNGIEVLMKIKEDYPEVEVVMLSGHDDVNIATTSIKFGANDYVVKNDSALINVKNKIRNIVRRMQVLKELAEVNVLKKKIGGAVAIGITVTLLVNLFS
jgi:two-component system, OmpR family, response regulator